MHHQGRPSERREKAFQTSYRSDLYPYSPDRPAESFSFIVDPNRDGTFTRNLRRKSLTGQAAHPISRQISEERVSIPVEFVEDDNRPSAFNRISGVHKSASISTVPRNRKREIERTNARRAPRIPVEHYDNAPSALAAALDEFSLEQSKIRNKTTPSSKPSYSEHSVVDEAYSPKKYEDRWALADHPPTYESLVTKGEDTSSKQEKKNTDSEKVTAKSSKLDAYEDHLREIDAQDEYIRTSYNLHRFLIIPDGNCLYRAVAQAVLLDQGQHAILRQLTIDHIREHKEEFKDIIEGDVEEFLVAAQLEGEWAGYPEILALSRWLDININITTGGTKSNPKVRTTLHYFPSIGEKNTSSSQPVGKGNGKNKASAKYTERQSIWLSWLSSGHYDMLSEKELENPSYEEWLHSRESRMKSDEEMATKMSMEDAENSRQENSHATDNFNNAKPGEAFAQPQQVHLPQTNSRTVKLAPIDSFLHTNQPRPNMANNTSQATCSDGMTTGCAPHEYPPPTYRSRSPATDIHRNSQPPSHWKPTTDMDEELALALQREEDEAQDGSLPPSLYYA